MPTVLALLPEGFEELEAIAPIDMLRRAGVEVTTASLTETLSVNGRNGITIQADATLSANPEKLHDMLLIPGGPGVKLLRADPRVSALVRAHAGAGRWLAAICAAPTVLNDAGLLAGLRYTCHTSVLNELPTALMQERVVVDANIITSRGAGTAIDFGLVLVKKLTTPEKAREIQASICA
ncbi:DJ-1 family glyoxalase III [Ereboglobus luteus]|uniref:Protease n=1 Tax=Ereboglobus luteus TaxID=1796921 RepID=A0A2U8E4G2_9BACT|nr:DJ-1 family glyoxalase III [Ereboglobus luteus]AWI09753.1 protease [Ereboglobus luteus]